MVEKTMDKIVALAKSRGFVYPGSEIYGGLANTWDYGNLGVELKNNVKKAWWQKFVQESPYNVGVDCAILMNPQTWIASGHLGGFSDPLMDCKECHERFRADKIIEDFSQENGIELESSVDGWSQEEMAEKLSVSRQAVSKWESAQSTPDLQKVLRLAEIFGVSTDYLLKDELKSETGTEILEYAAEESSVRSVSMEEANAFMEWRRKTGPTLAGAVALCIISPALLIFLAGLSDSHIGNISENMATGAGISVLLLLVAAAVVIFVSYSIHGQQYEYLEKERIETAYGVTGLVQERKKDYESTFTRGIAAGVTLCILAVIPMFAAIAFSQPDYIITATVSILLLLVAVGVFFIVRVSTINGSYVILLQEGEYTPEEKRYKKKTEVFTTAYWCIVTAIYLAWSFQTREWDKAWILWAVAGVLFGGVRAVMRGRIKEK